MGSLARFKLSTRMQLLVGLTLVGLLVLCVTAALSLWLGHLKGRTAPPLSCHASSR